MSHASSSENQASPVMAQMRKLSPEKHCELPRPHSYLEAKRNWMPWTSTWPHPSALLMTTNGHGSNREQMRKLQAQQDDTALLPPKQREDESTMFEAQGLSPRVTKLKKKFLKPTLITFNTLSEFLRN